MHSPPKRVLSEYPNLEQHIQDKNLKQGEDFGTKKGKNDTSERGRYSFTGCDFPGLLANSVSEPVGDLVDEAEPEDDERNVERECKEHVELSSSGV